MRQVKGEDVQLPWCGQGGHRHQSHRRSSRRRRTVTQMRTDFVGKIDIEPARIHRCIGRPSRLFYLSAREIVQFSNALENAGRHEHASMEEAMNAEVVREPEMTEETRHIDHGAVQYTMASLTVGCRLSPFSASRF